MFATLCAAKAKRPIVLRRAFVFFFRYYFFPENTSRRDDKKRSRFETEHAHSAAVPFGALIISENERNSLLRASRLTPTGPEYRRRNDFVHDYSPTRVRRSVFTQNGPALLFIRFALANLLPASHCYPERCVSVFPFSAFNRNLNVSTTKTPHTHTHTGRCPFTTKSNPPVGLTHWVVRRAVAIPAPIRLSESDNGTSKRVIIDVRKSLEKQRTSRRRRRAPITIAATIARQSLVTSRIRYVFYRVE